MAQVIEATVRVVAADKRVDGLMYDWQHNAVKCVITTLQSQHQVKPTDAAAVAAGGGTTSASRTSSGQQQRQQQVASVTTGVLLSCLKTLTWCLQQRSSHPLAVLLSVAHIAPVCPGLSTLSDTASSRWPFAEGAARSVTGAAGSSAAGSSAAAAAAAADLGAQHSATARQLQESGISSLLNSSMASLPRVGVASQAGRASSSSSSSSAVAGVVHEHAGSLMLLIGRALHVAAVALLQLHELQPSSSAQQLGLEQQAQQQQQHQQQQSEEENTGALDALCLIAMLYFYLAALGSLLEAASAAAGAAASSSAGGSSRAECSNAAGLQQIAALQQLQRHLLQETWLRLAQAMERATAAAAASLSHPNGLIALQAEFMAVFPAAAAQQMLQLATGVCTQFVSAKVAPLCCANPDCSNCAQLSERELVSGQEHSVQRLPGSAAVQC
jgi:hypothetical protein